jgi:hypothetical protein
MGHLYNVPKVITEQFDELRNLTVPQPKIEGPNFLTSRLSQEISIGSVRP